MFDYLVAKGSALKGALFKARNFLSQRLASFFEGKLDEHQIRKLENLLLEADFGQQLVAKILERLHVHARAQKEGGASFETLKRVICEVALAQDFPPLKVPKERPWTLMVVGVNGHGKTTTCAKLARFCQNSNLTPGLVAADTYRAAAPEQLQSWANQLDVSLSRGAERSSPASVIFDGLQFANARKLDACIIDTAGRLHNQPHLMEELQKMHRVCGKVQSGAPHQVFLVVEAPTGQNALNQAKLFAEHIPLTGFILTKIDGASKGGIALALQTECKTPVRFLGTGESVDDLRAFDTRAFIEALFD